ncbi:hypothetical protein JOM56_004818, partial [Amanita muscaria]
ALQEHKQQAKLVFRRNAGSRTALFNKIWSLHLSVRYLQLFFQQLPQQIKVAVSYLDELFKECWTSYGAKIDKPYPGVFET